jgi:hypothetical protein
MSESLFTAASSPSGLPTPRSRMAVIPERVAPLLGQLIRDAGLVLLAACRPLDEAVMTPRVYWTKVGWLSLLRGASVTVGMGQAHRAPIAGSVGLLLGRFSGGTR